MPRLAIAPSMRLPSPSEAAARAITPAETG
jgi:hypothetical protein